MKLYKNYRKNGYKINFNTVANESGVAKTFLYDNNEIQLEWVQSMNNIKNRVEEIIYNELIYI